MDFSKRYNREEFVKFLQNDFLPEEDFLAETIEAEIQQETKYIKTVTKLGASPSLRLAVYEARHTSSHDARVGLSKEIFRFMANKRERKALVAFVPEGNDANYRLSLISIDLVENNEGNVTRTYSNPRRYSYYLGKGIAYYTPNKYLNEIGRVTNPDDLRSRFSVEVLTKEFYQELSDWFAWAVKIISFPNNIDDAEDDDKYNHEGAIRLITRLIFVWFLKQRHLIPNEFFDEKYIADNLLKDFEPNKKEGFFEEKSLESRYYKAILQNLFFAMLNSPITKEGGNELSERHFRNGRKDYDNNKLMRYEYFFKNPQLFVDLANKTVPFLNGGLFDCLDNKDQGNYYDCFTDRREVNKFLIFPDFLFFGEEAGKNIDLSQWYGDKKKKKVSARGIIDILKRYNFTVEENTPFDQEVSLDPELLGKVFENLLASYNPETQTTARKQTGSFYTPREIVQYMVDESLVAHLKRTVGEEQEAEYRKLLQYTDDEITLTDEQKNQIMQSLYNCKILDPACGSGAFPVGMLQQMVHILSRIDPNNERWKDMILDEAVSESGDVVRAEIQEEREERLKDIERSFDEKLNNPDYARKLYLIENCIYGVDIQPVAIQISKLRFFISLVVDQKTNNNPADNFGIRPLPNLEAKFVAANTLIPLAKSEGNFGRTPEIVATEKRLKEANHKIFNAKTVKTKHKWKKRLNELRAELIQQLSDNGFFTDDAINQLASWNMFNQNASATFFDADWMFGVKEGFNIVIANPPYVFTRDVNFSTEFKKNIEKEYFSQTIRNKKSRSQQSGKINLFAIFVMRGIMLNSTNGVLSYILPNNLLRTTIYDVVRKYILENTTINQIVDLGTGVFSNVTASTIIIQLLNTKCQDSLVNIINEIKHLNLHEFNCNRLPQVQFETNTGFTFNIFSDTQSTIVSKKIEKAIFRLGDLCEYISPGIDGNRGKYVSDTPINTKYKPIIFGKNIERYRIDYDCKYILYDKKLLNRSRNEHIFISKKIVTQRISGGNTPVIASFDNGEYYTFNSVNNIILKENTIENFYYILALLNSRILNWYYTNNFSNKSNLTVNVSKTHLQMLPIPQVSKNTKSAVYALVKQIMEHKKNGNDDTAYLEMTIDQILYKLYDLTYDEVKIIDPDTPITREDYEKI